MRADRAEVRWDQKKGKWMVQIQSGEEVIRRFSDLPHGADEPALRAAATKALEDEGYEPNATPVVVQR